MIPYHRRMPRRDYYPAVLVLDFRPSGIPRHWEKTSILVEQYRAALRVVSGGRVSYLVVQHETVERFPVPYDAEGYQAALSDSSRALRAHDGSYVMADYLQILRDHFVQHRIEADGFDEVWMFGGPYFGFYESRMIGREAFWCNAPPLTLDCARFVMMGFSYERGVREMLHNFGHRAESILACQFHSTPYLNGMYARPDIVPPAPQNEFEQFLLDHGTVHRTPGGVEYGQDERTWLTALDRKWWPYLIDPNLVRP